MTSTCIHMPLHRLPGCLGFSALKAGIKFPTLWLHLPLSHYHPQVIWLAVVLDDPSSQHVFDLIVQLVLLWRETQDVCFPHDPSALHIHTKNFLLHWSDITLSNMTAPWLCLTKYNKLMCYVFWHFFFRKYPFDISWLLQTRHAPQKLLFWRPAQSFSHHCLAIIKRPEIVHSAQFSYFWCIIVDASASLSHPVASVKMERWLLLSTSPATGHNVIPDWYIIEHIYCMPVYFLFFHLNYEVH